jgi:hypothetical protein
MNGMLEIFVLFAIITGLAIHFSYQARKKKLAAVLTAILVTTSLSLFLVSMEEKGYEQIYSVSVEPASEGTFELMVPAAVDYKNNSHLLMDRLMVKSGNPVFERLNTSRGPALRISADSCFTLESRLARHETALFGIAWSPPEEPVLSMLNNSERRTLFYWFYCNVSGNSSLKIEVSCHAGIDYAGGALIELPFYGGASSISREVEGTLAGTGWRLMEGEVRHIAT